MSTITKIAFPDPDLLSDVQSRLSESARSALDLRVWSAEHPDSDPADLDAVILPYLGAEATVAKLDDINDLKLVQAQTTGYDVSTTWSARSPSPRVLGHMRQRPQNLPSPSFWRGCGDSTRRRAIS